MHHFHQTHIIKIIKSSLLFFYVHHHPIRLTLSSCYGRVKTPELFSHNPIFHCHLYPQIQHESLPAGLEFKSVVLGQVHCMPAIGMKFPCFQFKVEEIDGSFFPKDFPSFILQGTAANEKDHNARHNGYLSDCSTSACMIKLSSDLIFQQQWETCNELFSPTLSNLHIKFAEQLEKHARQ